jgi:hypothetical protein
MILKNYAGSSHKALLRGVVFTSWLLLILSLLSPLIVADYGHFTGYFLWVFFASFFLFYFGLYLAVGIKPVLPRVTVDPELVVGVFFVLSLVGIFARLGDRFWLRPPVDLLSIADVRDSRLAGSNLFSIFAGLVSPLVLIIYDMLRERALLSAKIKILSFVFFSVVVLDVLLSGSRGILLIYIACLFGPRLRAGRVAIIGLLVLCLSGWFFLHRYESLAPSGDVLSIINFVSTAGYSYFVPVSQSLLSELNEFWAIFAFPFIQINQYIAHGIFEYAYIVHSMPAHNFEPSRMIPHFAPFFNYSAQVQREGMYYTFPGTLYICLGFMGVIFCFLFGLLFGILYMRAWRLGRGSVLVVSLAVFMVPYVDSFGGYDFYFYFLSIAIFSSFDIRVCKRTGCVPVSVRSIGTS